MKPIDNRGKELDSQFSVEPTPSGINLVLESRGGSNGIETKARNTEYAPSLSLLMSRMAARGAILRDVQVASRVTQDWPPERRQLVAPTFSYPVDLAAVTDMEQLRNELGRACAGLGRAPERTGGNPTKRIRLILDWPEMVGRTGAAVELFLARPEQNPDEGYSNTSTVDKSAEGRSWTEVELEACVNAYRRLTLGAAAETPIRKKEVRQEVLAGPLAGRSAGAYEFRMQNISAVLAELGLPILTGYLPRKNTGAVKPNLIRLINDAWQRQNVSEGLTYVPVELETRVIAARQRLRDLGGKLPLPPASNCQITSTVAQTTRFQRDPNVIAWVLETAGRICEACESIAPFTRPNGDPYLEVHHVRPLAEGGPDRVDNAIAGCPNCHRSLHHGANRSTLRQSIIRKIERIIDYPHITISTKEDI